jgi:NADH:ubiquinone oxidoreductase subunit E
MESKPMLEVYVCIGTSCHLRGGERIAEQVMSLVGELGLEERVQVRGAFCLESCSAEGVAVKVGEKVFGGVKPDTDDVRDRLLPEILFHAGRN